MLQTVVPWCLVALLLSSGVVMIRLLLGPSRADRAMALDVLTILAAGVLGAFAIMEDRAAYLSVALVIALVSFLGTVAIAVLLQRLGTDEAARKGGQRS